jgi:ABC-type lipoprotein release transport system permease subunit
MIKIGWRNLWRNKRRSLIILGALVIGIWGLVMMYGVNRGWMVGMIEMAIMSYNSHLQVHAQGYQDDPEVSLIIPDPQVIEGRLRGLDHVVAVSPRAQARGMLSGARESAGVILVGIAPESEARVTSIFAGIKQGRWLSGDDTRAVLIGEPLARKLGVGPGKKLVAYTRDVHQDLKAIGLKVTGVYSTGNDAVDKFMVFVPLSYLQSELGLKDGIHEIAIRIDHDDNLAAVKRAVAGSLTDRPNLEIITWRESYHFLVEMFDLTVIANYILLAIVGAAISLGIANTMVMSVFERFREIGIMRAVGTRPAQIFSIVMVESLSLAVTGLALGTAISYVTLRIWNLYGLDLSIAEKSLATFGMPTIIYPIVAIEDWTITWMAVALMALLSGLYPAVKAARKNPVEAMRG